MSHLDTFHHGSDEHTSTYTAGEFVYRKGDAADCMHVVVEGEAEILIGDRVLEVVGAPNFFGEMALVGHTARSADVRAKTDLKLERIDERRFSFMVQNTPHFALEVLRVMAERLRKMDEPVASAG